MSSNITLGVTGLDTETIIQELMKVERRPLQLLEARQSVVAGRRSAWDSVTQRLNSLAAKISPLTRAGTFDGKSVSITNPSAISVEVSDSAAVGTYDIKVISLAEKQVLQSDPFELESANEAAGLSGSLHLKGEEVLLEATDSLNDIAGKINSMQAGFSAVVIKTGSLASELSQFRMVITASKTGTAGQLEPVHLGIDPGNPGDPSLWKDLGVVLEVPASPETVALNQVQAAKDAAFRLNGLTVTRAENRIADALQGVTIELLASGDEPGGTNSACQFTVSPDDQRIVNDLKAFVEEYNSLIEVVKKHTAWDPQTREGGLLLGDTLLQRLLQEIRSLIFRHINQGMPGFGFVGQIGLSTGVLGSFSRDGKLSFDESKLREALAEHRDAVETLFGAGASAEGDGEGIFKVLEGAVGRYTSTGGLLPLRKQELEAQDRDLARQIEEKQRTIDLRLNALKRQFTALEMLIFRVNGQSAWLAQQVAGFFQT